MAVTIGQWCWYFLVFMPAALILTPTVITMLNIIQTVISRKGGDALFNNAHEKRFIHIVTTCSTFSGDFMIIIKVYQQTSTTNEASNPHLGYIMFDFY